MSRTYLTASCLIPIGYKKYYSKQTTYDIFRHRVNVVA